MRKPAAYSAESTRVLCAEYFSAFRTISLRQPLAVWRLTVLLRPCALRCRMCRFSVSEWAVFVGQMADEILFECEAVEDRVVGFLYGTDERVPLPVAAWRLFFLLAWQMSCLWPDAMDIAGDWALSLRQFDAVGLAAGCSVLSGKGVSIVFVGQSGLGIPWRAPVSISEHIVMVLVRFAMVPFHPIMVWKFACICLPLRMPSLLKREAHTMS